MSKHQCTLSKLTNYRCKTHRIPFQLGLCYRENKNTIDYNISCCYASPKNMFPSTRSISFRQMGGQRNIFTEKVLIQGAIENKSQRTKRSETCLLIHNKMLNTTLVCSYKCTRGSYVYIFISQKNWLSKKMIKIIFKNLNYKIC